MSICASSSSSSFKGRFHRHPHHLFQEKRKKRNVRRKSHGNLPWNSNHVWRFSYERWIIYGILFCSRYFSFSFIFPTFFPHFSSSFCRGKYWKTLASIWAFMDTFLSPLPPNKVVFAPYNPFPIGLAVYQLSPCYDGPFFTGFYHTLPRS